MSNEIVEPEVTLPINIESEMQDSFLEYAMSVIVSRALPDVRDGLKPVHRRVLYSMWDSGIRPGTPYRKASRVVGDVVGWFHPHAPEAVTTPWFGLPRISLCEPPSSIRRGTSVPSMIRQRQ